MSNIKVRQGDGRIQSPSSVKVKVKQDDGRIQSQSPVTVKGLINGIKNIHEIGDVDEVDLVDGATLIYDADSKIYYIKKLNINDLEGTIDLDYGTF